MDADDSQVLRLREYDAQHAYQAIDRYRMTWVARSSTLQS
jgi:hypothetical protein